MKFFLWIFYRSYRSSSRLRYWLRRRFTRSGLVVFAGILTAAIIGVDTENTVTYQALTPLVCLLLVAFVFSWFFRARFSATRLLPRFGTAGRPFYYRVLLKNLTPKAQNDLTLLENLADPRLSFRDWRAILFAYTRETRSFRFGRRITNPFKLASVKEAAVSPLPPGGEAEVQVEVMPLRRGVLRFTGMTFARTDPFGLFRSFVKLPLPQTVLILPKRYPVPPIALPGTMKYQEGGVALASNVGRSEEFVSLRDYRRGDPLRHVHWRSWAKVGKPIVKEFEDEFFVRHALILDTFTENPYSEMFEEAVSVASSFACTLLTQESLLDLLFVGAQAYCLTAGRGLAHVEEMLEILASVRTCGDKSFQSLEHLVLNHAGTVSGCICVLLKWDEERRRFVDKLKSIGVPVLTLVVTVPGKGKSLEQLRNRPERFYVLEVGRIEEGLAKLP